MQPLTVFEENSSLAIDTSESSSELDVLLLKNVRLLEENTDKLAIIQPIIHLTAPPKVVVEKENDNDNSSPLDNQISNNLDQTKTRNQNNSTETSNENTNKGGIPHQIDITMDDTSSDSEESLSCNDPHCEVS